MTEGPQMYELMYVVNPVLNEEQTKNIIARVGKYLEEHGCDVVRQDEIGSQRLAYPIEKKRNGYYVVKYFTGPGQFIARLERALNINDDILRHLVLRYDAKMLRHFEKAQRGELKQVSAPRLLDDEEGGSDE